MEIKQKIEILFNSGLSGYAIAKETGVNQSSISKFMNGTRPIENMTLETAQKLSDLYDKRINDVELPANYDVIKKVFRLEFKEILESQLDLYKESPNTDDKLMFNYLYHEFDKVMHDNQTIYEIGDLVNNMVEPSQQMIDEL
ncbi:helix-turn-helix domain-containing protein [Fructobacillus ficulneus]|uniref:HTH cro/C1-type domain-containing protein n=1 Tax=Fructobacillus ficulneus TaxID=157463 RepID=A0A0K8MIV1_9LACO|nr:helix-turn-helix transcriptional regulator [Fructobacillus ficulneus]GAO99819.1 hypothetical protein FFIC_240940 [Fructobacillus ficulneus]